MERGQINNLREYVAERAIEYLEARDVELNELRARVVKLEHFKQEHSCHCCDVFLDPKYATECDLCDKKSCNDCLEACCVNIMLWSTVCSKCIKVLPTQCSECKCHVKWVTTNDGNIVPETVGFMGVCLQCNDAICEHCFKPDCDFCLEHKGHFGFRVE